MFAGTSINEWRESNNKKINEKLNWNWKKTESLKTVHTNRLFIARLVLKSQANKIQKRTENGVYCVYNIMFMMINLRICFVCANCERVKYVQHASYVDNRNKIIWIPVKWVWEMWMKCVFVCIAYVNGVLKKCYMMCATKYTHRYQMKRENEINDDRPTNRPNRTNEGATAAEPIFMCYLCTCKKILRLSIGKPCAQPFNLYT